MFDNVPKKFLPLQEYWPDFIYAHPNASYVHTSEKLNAASEILDVGISKNGWGGNVAIYDANKDESWTYLRLQEEVNRLGNALLKLGVQPGDRVVWRFGEVPEAAVAQLAIWKIGAINVPSALPERAREIEFIANDTEAKVIICQGDEVDQVLKALPSLKTVEHVISVPESRDDKLLDYRQLLDASGADLEVYPTSPTDAASIFYTGGTTGHPKGCIHSHAAEVITADIMCGQVYAPTVKDVFLCLPPLGHAFGNGEKINFPFRFGAAVVYKERPGSVETWELIEKYRVTILAAAPTSYRLMLDCLKADRRGKWPLRFVVASGEMMGKDLAENWFEKIGVEIHNSVGMSPMRHIFIESALHGIKVAPGISVGKPLHGYEFKLVDDKGNRVKNGEIGRLAVRGLTGVVYWCNLHPQMPGKQQEDVINGWNLLDDAYTQDEDGWLYFSTRLDNMIVTAGRQVAAPEIEEVLTGHPAVHQAAVVGVPDPVRTNIVKAFIELNPGYAPSEELIKELQEYAKENMATYKYPRIIQFIEELPRDEVGKIQRRLLRQQSVQ